MEKIYREGGRKKKRVNAHRSRPILFEAESEEEEEFELEVEVNNPKKNWTCAACTFRNKYSSSFCTLCHQGRFTPSNVFFLVDGCRYFLITNQPIHI